ncbi:pogo transposable element with ZNF domain [Trichonephila clavata]|uniref:Pogo transposable element with ZNF domain n=1 Tax=Trichonephila clavata TaxID=2740835 RepID=A0A8X6FRK8_TRICU|nr:pogo transposable element with ZNF domain [Trichonephila clavata]
MWFGLHGRWKVILDERLNPDWSAGLGRGAVTADAVLRFRREKEPSDVQNKASEILSIIGEAEVKKNCWWFYLWNKRGMDPEKNYEEEADVDVLEKESRVNYPPAVKVEIAKVAERQSVNCAARCFRVARKRIREWVKCKVS